MLSGSSVNDLRGPLSLCGHVQDAVERDVRDALMHDAGEHVRGDAEELACGAELRDELRNAPGWR